MLTRNARSEQELMAKNHIEKEKKLEVNKEHLYKDSLDKYVEMQHVRENGIQMGRRACKTDYDEYNRHKEKEKKVQKAPEYHSHLPQQGWHNNDYQVFETEHARERNYLAKVKNETVDKANYNNTHHLATKINKEVKTDKQEGKNMVMGQKERMDKRHHDANEWSRAQGAE